VFNNLPTRWAGRTDLHNELYVKHHTVDQYSEDWKRLRLGIPTASNFHLLMTPGGKPTSPDNKERRQYLYRLVAERILQTTMPDRFAGNQFTDDGHEREGAAADRFPGELLPAGFFTTDDGRTGCSPDRVFAHRNEAVEIKAPAPWTHIQYMVEGPGDKYKAQVQGQIMIGEFDCCHFWSYHPDFAAVHIRTRPDPRYIALLRLQLNLFLDELDNVERYVRRHGNVAVLLKEVSDAD
jgi:hypothetical protein